MNPREEGFLLLTSHLGNPDRNVLSTVQLRTLADRVRAAQIPAQDRDLSERDLISLGYSREFSQRILGLLEERELLTHYVKKGQSAGCIPITRVSGQYPLLLRQRLGLDSPGCLWAKGDISLLDTPAVSLVGSREIKAPNREFAEAVGYQAAVQGLTLVSGNARGADKTAQNACLAAGGRVISILADSLLAHKPRKQMLYLSEDGFDESFSPRRALSRNRCIHALGQMVFVAQSDQGKGGTWDGTARNLHFGWSPVACFRDGSEASRELEQLGAFLIDREDLLELSALAEPEPHFF